MADSVENTDVDLDQLHARAPEPASPAAQIRKALRGKHVCPFCGTTRESELGPCPQCSLEDTPNTRAATRSKLGPWYVLQSRNPSAPGMNFATLLMLVRKGRVTARSVIRGPTTGQFWRHAAKVKGVSREFGLCWNCGGDVQATGRACPNCKRLQEPPLNPDALLEVGESADTVAEQMWAVDESAGSGPERPRSRANGAGRRIDDDLDDHAGVHPTGDSPVDRLAARGGVRREVAPGPKTVPNNGNHGLIADADEELQVVSRPLEMAVFQGAYGEAPRKPGRRFIARLFKVLSIALLTAGLSIGTWCYFDPAVAARVTEYWNQIATWAGISRNPADPDKDPRATGQSGSTLTREEARVKGYDLWEAGRKAEEAKDYAAAIKYWEEIRTLPIDDVDKPLGLDVYIRRAKSKLAGK